MAEDTGGAGQALRWVQRSAGKQAYELRAGDEVTGSLVWQRGTLAVGKVGDRRWTIQREGFWHPRITVRVEESELNTVVLHQSWRGGGILELTSGRMVRFKAANVWRSQWDWQEAEGEALVRFRSRQGFNSGAELEIMPAAAGFPELSLLAVLGWYLILLGARDSAVGSSAAVIAATSSTSSS
ncbi:MAG: hypothetical protein DLM67_12530 [Candidatus Nephthysia bennettiae]|nr:MAG: hypothetical protein DLM67_12530 [Candidatus Dormibacteraeota bacterium]